MFMKKIITGCILLSTLAATSQNRQNENDSIYRVNLRNYNSGLLTLNTKFNLQLFSDTTGILNPYVYNKYVENKFTYLSFERGVLPVVNSASLDISENATQLKLNFSKKITAPDGIIKGIISTGVQAKLGDGVAELFKGSVTSAGTTFFVNGSILQRGYHFKTVTSRFINGREVVTAFGKSKPQLIKYKRNFENKYLDGSLNSYQYFINRLKEINTQIIRNQLETDCCKVVEDQIKEEHDILNNLSAVEYADTIQKALHEFRLKQLEIERCNCVAAVKLAWSNLYKEKEEIERRLQESGIIDGKTDDVVESIETKYQDGYYDLLTKSPAWEVFKLKWISFGLTYSRDTYATYDTALIFNKRFTSRDFDSWGVKITQNWFKQKHQQAGLIRSWYANLSYQPKRSNSYEDIIALDILKTTGIGRRGDTSYTLQTSKKAKDITGIPFKTVWQHTFSSAFTAMLFKKANIGLNLLAQSAFSVISAPVFNTRAGVIFSIANSNYDSADKNSKAKVNFEFFIQFPDMSDVSASGKSVWQKRILGISTNIPFNKIFLK